MTGINPFLDMVAARVRASLAATYVSSTRFDERLLWGKRLRARMADAVGQELALRERVGVAAAVELFHTASLLHDDVIDGALVRRAVPADWALRGAAASVLLGDRFIVQCLEILAADAPRCIPRFLCAMGEICDAEMEHETLIDCNAIPYERLAGIARRKTGGLFAFIGWACGGDSPHLTAALETCGYTLGLAYQFADDLLDSAPAAIGAGKTPGTDRKRGKPTLAFLSVSEIGASILRQLRSSSERLEEWPAIASGWQHYLGHIELLMGSGSSFEIAPV